MKKRSFSTLLRSLANSCALAALFLLPQAMAQSEEDTHNALRSVRDAMQHALNQRDMNALLAHVTDDVVFTTMNGDRVIGKAGIAAYFGKMLEGDKPLVKSVQTHFTVETLSHLHGDNTAIAFGHSEDAYELGDGSRFTVHPQWSAALVRTEAGWKIANFHYSVNMFDNPVLHTQRQWLLIAGGALALLTLALGYWLGRRKRPA